MESLQELHDRSPVTLEGFATDFASDFNASPDSLPPAGRFAYKAGLHLPEMHPTLQARRRSRLSP
jgi:hypothetical protein